MIQRFVTGGLFFTKLPLVKATNKPAAGRKDTPPFSTLSTDGKTEAIYTLWEELDRFPASETDRALEHLALEVKKLLSADNVRWLAAVRVMRGAEGRKDSLKGWRLRARHDLVPDPEEYYKLLAWLFQRHNRTDPDFAIGLATHALIAKFGKFQVHRMRDGWIPYHEFSQSTHYPLHYTSLDITDRIWLSFPLRQSTSALESTPGRN